MIIREREGVKATGWNEYSTWEHSAHIRDLYTRRAKQEEVEMTCAAQAAELLQGRVRAGETVLDAGCGSGYFWHSLRQRNIPATYLGIDASATLIDIGRIHLAQFGLPSGQLQVMRFEDLAGSADHVVCMNVLSHIDNYHRPLERLLKVAKRTLVLRESLAEVGSYRYVVERFLDGGVELKVHVNAYPIKDVEEFMASYGFTVRRVVDRYTGGKPQDVIGYSHHWTFLVAEK